MTSVSHALAMEGDATRCLELLSNTAVLKKEMKSCIDHKEHEVTSSNQDRTATKDQNVSEQQPQPFEVVVHRPPCDQHHFDQNHPMNRISPDLPFENAQNRAPLPHFYQAQPPHPLDDNVRRSLVPSQLSLSNSSASHWNVHYAHHHAYQHHDQRQAAVPANGSHFEAVALKRTERSYYPIKPSNTSDLPRPAQGRRVLSSESAAGNVEMGRVYYMQHPQTSAASSTFVRMSQGPPLPTYESTRMISESSDKGQETEPHGNITSIQQQYYHQYKQHYHQQEQRPNESRSGPRETERPEHVIRILSQQLKAKDEIIANLQQKLTDFESEVQELRWLPTGKISQIPIADMIKIMEIYGSEVSTHKFSKRKQPIQRASIVRQFRRWNPEFFRYFFHVRGEWVPKLGREKEIERRAARRSELAAQRARQAGQLPINITMSSSSSLSSS